MLTRTAWLIKTDFRIAFHAWLPVQMQLIYRSVFVAVTDEPMPASVIWNARPVSEAELSDWLIEVLVKVFENFSYFWTIENALAT